MTFTERLKRLMFRMSRIRFVSKKKMEERELQDACNKEAFALDELEALALNELEELTLVKNQRQLAGFGMDGASSSHGTHAESIDPRSSIDSFGIGSSKSVEDPSPKSTKENIDSRFIMNPIGIGCSRSFENPSHEVAQNTETVPSKSISRDSRSFPCGGGNAEDDDRPSTSGPQETFFKLSARVGPESLHIHGMEGKGKGRADEAEIEEAGMMRYWITQIERGNLVPQDEATKEFMAFVRGRAWTL